VKDLNSARLSLLESIPGTQMKRKGVLSLDDTLLTHYGRHFEKIAYLYDHVERHYVWAHNLVNLHYSDDQTDYPVKFTLWEPADVKAMEDGLIAAGIKINKGKYVLKEEDPKKWRNYLLNLWRRHQNKPAVQKTYESKLILGQQMLAEFYSEHPDLKLPVTFDNWYTQPSFCRYLDKTLKVPFVGTLSDEDQVVLETGQKRLDEFDRQLREEHDEAIKAGKSPVFTKITIPYKGDKETYYSYCKILNIHNFGKQRLVINHGKKDLSDTAKLYITNKLNWQAAGITRIRRHRWPVEVYHEEGKEEGLDQYQVRDFNAILRHIALVSVTYSLLRAAQHDNALFHKLQQTVETKLDGSAASWRRNTEAYSLWALATFIATGISQGQSLHSIMAPLMSAVSY